ncbi:MAG: alpha/beta fold hydrolase [Spartobacteria bacterium]|nr:alpha/beta fold hydrolase [Spartobacteria bacterium]
MNGNTKISIVEGEISFRTHHIWYRSVDPDVDAGAAPLLCLHGGPGATHDYLEPLEAVARSGRRVIFYDQLGNGNSDQPHDPSLWTFDLFLDELEAVRRVLGLKRVHILGQSWGGMLALQYALGKPEGVMSLTLASATPCTRQWIEEANRLRSELPEETQRILAEHEKAGTTASPEYGDAMMVFYRRHVCRLDPWPECLNRSLEKMMQNPEVYLTMWGPSEFYMNGTLKNWDVTSRLGEIRIPTLITSGKHDESTPAIAETLKNGIPGARHVLFEHSAHESHIEERERYIHVLTAFLKSVHS